MKVLKFGAVWCKECLVMRPLWQELENELAWLSTEYVDIDESFERAETYGVDRVPTALLVDEEGKELDRLSGMKDKTDIMQILLKYEKK